MNYVRVGSSFTIAIETPCADPHAGCCGGWGLETPGYPIMFPVFCYDVYLYSDYTHM